MSDPGREIDPSSLIGGACAIAVVVAHHHPLVTRSAASLASAASSTGPTTDNDSGVVICPCSQSTWLSSICPVTIRVHTGYARANHEAHTLIRQALTGRGDIDPGNGVLTVRLDSLPTQRATTAIAQLCAHLTATNTRYPGTDLILRNEVKTRP